MALTLTSSAYSSSGDIPARYTCEGADISPPLSWNSVPDGTRSLVLIIDDPDAPDPAAPKLVWVHWVLFNITPERTTLSEDASSGNLPPGAKQGLNDWQNIGYGGPCPPIGRHRYYHRLYALDTRLSFSSPPTRDEVDAAMAGHVLSEGTLMGTYEKSAADQR